MCFKLKGIKNFILMSAILTFFSTAVSAEEAKVLTAEASCAISTYSQQQAQQVALDRARQILIEQANGVKIDSTTVVTDGRFGLESIRSSSKGYTYDEKAEYDSRLYKRNPNDRGIQEYIVRLTAKVKPIKLKSFFKLDAKLNKETFVAGDAAAVRMKSGKSIEVAIFYHGTDDLFYKLAPNDKECAVYVRAGLDYIFPEPSGELELITTSEGRDQLKEELVIIAIPESKETVLSQVFINDKYSYLDFSKTFDEISDRAIWKSLSYTVFKK